MITKLKDTLNSYLKPLAPLKNIAWFLTLFVLFDFIWKLFVHEGADESVLLVFGKDVTSSVHGLCVSIANITYWVVHTLLGYSDFKIDGTMIYFEGSLRMDIIWGCTGLKQLIMFTFIVACYFGPIKKKVWFIPLSLFILSIINIIRLAVIAIIIKDGFPHWFISVNEWYNNRTWDTSRQTYWQFCTDWFNVFHKDIFVWVYYDGVMFILWLIWEEKINKPYQKWRKNEKQSVAQDK